MAMACTASLASSRCSSLDPPRFHSGSSGASPLVLPLLKPRSVAARSKSRVVMSAKSNDLQALVGPSTLALLAAAIIPEIAEAASPGVSPSLKNLLLSVAAGGTVLLGIGGAVAAVSLFDPVQRK